ncbi:Eukaryotic peptide chain release factor GTP-binding subunit [Vanrija albida]|uniref:Palmitoyltransferase n=1 Tax=Vanrija albida TaxID=181172 RepID=A0ABR3PX34_9TREE
MTSPSNSEPFGLSLPSRRANVTVTRRASVHSDNENDDSVAPLGRDSLEGTRRYYNVDSPGPSTGARQRTLSNTNSPRPVSQTPSESSFTMRSPPRSAAPLPTPRGFLAPQKPAAARRLEQRERIPQVSSSGRTSTDQRPVPAEYEGVPSPTEMSQSSHNHSPALPPGRTFKLSQIKPAAGSPNLSRPKSPPQTFEPKWPTHPSASAGKDARPAQPRPSQQIVSAPRPNPIQATQQGSSHGHGSALGHGDTALPTSHSQAWERGTDTSSPSHPHHPDLSSDHLVILDSLAAEKPHKGSTTGTSTTVGRRTNYEDARVPTTVRKYQRFDEDVHSTFFCGGRLMTGGSSPWSFIISIILLLGIAGVWVGTTGVWLWRHGNRYGLAHGGGIAINVVFAYLFGLSVSSMIAASFREPGILPRNLDPDPPYTRIDVYWEANPREIRVGKDGVDKVNVKYCETCKSYRPPRCSHCRLCGNCVEGIDHHCAYLHGCVGRRNYFAFLVFVIATSISDIYVVVFSAIHFSLLCHHDHVSFGRALRDSPGAAVSFLLGLLTLAPVMFLLWYHIRLLLYNLTTIEQIRASASNNWMRATTRPYNPFAAPTWGRNVILASIGRPQVPSWIDANGRVVEDNRRVNPALTTPEKYLELV